MNYLTDEIIKKVMLYTTHPIADIMKINFVTTNLGIKIQVYSRVFWARNTSNPTIEELSEEYVCEIVWQYEN